MKTRNHSGSTELAEQAQNAADSMAGVARAARDLAIDRARGLYQNAQDKAITGAKAADQVIRANPYKAIGIAFGVGLLLGYFRTRRED